MYDNSIYFGNLSVQTKIIIKTKLPLPLHSSYSFLNCWKLLSLWIWNFQTLSFFNVLWKIKRNYINGLFRIANLLKVGKKKNIFWKFYGFERPPNQNVVKYFHNKCSYRNFIETRIAEKLRKNRIKVCNLTKITKS